MTGAAWLHGKVKVGLPDGAELRCTSSVFETHRNGKGSAFVGMCWPGSKPWATFCRAASSRGRYLIAGKSARFQPGQSAACF
jgi:hypothetical protein